MRKKLMVILLICAAVVAAAIVVVLLLQLRPSAPVQQPDAPLVTQAPTEIPPEQSNQGSGSSSASNPLLADGTPEGVISYYMQKWNEKNTVEMDGCRIEADRGLYSYSDLPLESSIEVLSIATQPSEDAKARFNEEWYENPVDIALVLVSFNISYNEEGKELYLRDTVEHTDYQFWLVRETADTGWRIVIQGY